MELYLQKIPVMRYNPENGQYFKGHKPWNKGLKGVCCGGEETQYKDGHLPHNTKYDGCITIKFHKKSKIYYKQIRIRPNKWQLLQRFTWEKENGPIPTGSVIRFKDGDTLNCEDINNLECISMAENLKRNANYKKSSETMKKIWRSTKLRFRAGLPPETKWGERMERGIV